MIEQIQERYENNCKATPNQQYTEKVKLEYQNIKSQNNKPKTFF